jgi:hypothetical protein
MFGERVVCVGGEGTLPGADNAYSTRCGPRKGGLYSLDACALPVGNRVRVYPQKKGLFRRANFTAYKCAVITMVLTGASV